MKRRALLLGFAVPFAAPRAQELVEVNTARRAALESLPGVGPALAQRLMDARPFADWPDLMRRVPGVKSALARKLSEAGLRVAGAHYSPAKG